MKAFSITIFVLFLVMACQSPKSQVELINHDLEQVIKDYQLYKDHQSPFNQDISGKTNSQLPDLSPKNLEAARSIFACYLSTLRTS